MCFYIFSPCSTEGCPGITPGPPTEWPKFCGNAFCNDSFHSFFSADTSGNEDFPCEVCDPESSEFSPAPIYAMIRHPPGQNAIMTTSAQLIRGHGPLAREGLRKSILPPRQTVSDITPSVFDPCWRNIYGREIAMLPFSLGESIEEQLFCNEKVLPLLMDELPAAVVSSLETLKPEPTTAQRYLFSVEGLRWSAERWWVEFCAHDLDSTMFPENETSHSHISQPRSRDSWASYYHRVADQLPYLQIETRWKAHLSRRMSEALHSVHNFVDSERRLSRPLQPGRANASG